MQSSLGAIVRRKVQRSIAAGGLGIDLDLVGQQQFRHVLVAIKRRGAILPLARVRFMRASLQRA